MKPIFKTSYAVVLLILLMSGCRREAVGIKEVPDDIIATKPCPTLYTSIMDQFPEFKNNETKQGVLFDATSKKRIVLLRESEVYVTFISEGAGYNNSFGYYVYDSTSAPSSASQANVQVLFPSVSGKKLKQGDMLQLGTGKFPAGTVIGFVLIVGGWENQTVNMDKMKLYTDYHFNPNGQQQHVLFKQKDCGDVVLAFEDKILTESSDADFNDIIFTVTDNRSDLEVSAFDLRAVIRM
jgi:hypothetical protein